MGNGNSIFLYSIIIITIGYLLKRFGVIREEEGSVLSKLILNLTLPAVVLQTVPHVAVSASLLYFPGLSLGYSSVMLGISFLVFRNREARIKGIALMCAVGFNTGLFAFPIIRAVWGTDGLQYIAMFDLANSFMLLGVNYVIGDYYSKRAVGESASFGVRYVARNLARSTSLMSYLIALALALASIRLPRFIEGLLALPAQANSVLVFLLLGTYLNLKIDNTRTLLLVKLLLLRYGIGLCVGLLLYRLLPLPHLVRVIAATALILPVGMTVIPFSAKFRLDYRFASIVVNGTMVISFFIMWVYANVL